MLNLIRRHKGQQPDKIIAIISVRNAEHYIDTCINDLVMNELEVAVLDNGSTDATNKILSGMSHKLLYFGEIPFDGEFRLARILNAKMDLARQLGADWIVHVDADEILRTCIDGESLRKGIERAAKSGATVINFKEFVFIPTSDEVDFTGTDYRETMKWYYYHEPKKGKKWYYHFQPKKAARCMRAFSSELSNTSGAGHKVSGGRVRLFKEHFVLCHYISLSMQMFRDKYSKRIYAKDALAKGWHENRATLRDFIVKAPRKEHLKCWDDRCVESLDRSDPQVKHFWEWSHSDGAISMCGMSFPKS